MPGWNSGRGVVVHVTPDDAHHSYRTSAGRRWPSASGGRRCRNSHGFGRLLRRGWARGPSPTLAGGWCAIRIWDPIPAQPHPAQQEARIPPLPFPSHVFFLRHARARAHAHTHTREARTKSRAASLCPPIGRSPRAVRHAARCLDPANRAHPSGSFHRRARVVFGSIGREASNVSWPWH